MTSSKIVIWVGLAWSVTQLLRFAALGRLYRRRGEVAPPAFVRNVAGIAAAAGLFGALLVSTARPLALTCFLVAIGLLAFEVIRGVAR